MEMFQYQGKLRKVVSEKVIQSYKAMYEYLDDLMAAGELQTHHNYLNDNELATNIYEKKYYLKDIEGNLIDRRPEDVFRRISSFTSAVEKNREIQKEWAVKFYNELYNGRFMPGGRVIAGAGDLYRLKTLANCFVTQIDKDSIDAIYQAAYESARTYSYGGGIGVDISSLRPRNSVVHNASDHSTGAVSFMDLFSLTTGLIGQSGRRGALMLTVDIKHPDIVDFINVKKNPNWVTNQVIEQCKWSGKFDDEQIREIEKNVAENTQIRFANISIKVSDEFMQAVQEQSQYGNSTIIVYKKNNNKHVYHAPQTDDLHYSEGIPSKDIDDYQELKTFSDFTKLRRWLRDEYSVTISEETLQSDASRDVFGDYLVELLEEKYELAIRYSGDFLLYFESEESGEIRKLVKARTIWDQFIEGNYRTAEPGLIFWSTMSKNSPSNYANLPIICTNPCAEVPLENGGACNLGSINLSRFVRKSYTDDATVAWRQLRESVKVATRFLDNVVTWNESLNPLEKQRKAVGQTRRLGLGVMGVADMLNQLGLAYDSEAGIKLIGKIMATIADTAYAASADLASEKGASPAFDEKLYLQCPFLKDGISSETRKKIKKQGIRNIAITAIAPTGSISNIVLGYVEDNKHYIGVSGGVEPLFALFYSRRSESFDNQVFQIFHPTVQAYVDKFGLSDAVERTENLEDILPEHFFRTAHEIDPAKRVQIQGICQKYVDHSISSTVNLPENIEPEVISDIYLQAWKNKLKGITIYRDGSRYPILSVEGKETPFQWAKQKTFLIELENGEEIEVRGDEVLKLPSGDLTTVYHHVSRSSNKTTNLKKPSAQELAI